MPEWKVKSVARNMGAMFVGQGGDAALLCSDPAFTYFVIAGSLVPKPTTERAPSLLVASPNSSSDSSSGGSVHPESPEESAVGSTATTVSNTSTGNQSQTSNGLAAEVICNRLKTASYGFPGEDETCTQIQTDADAFRATETGVVAVAVGRQSGEHGCPVEDPVMSSPSRIHHHHHHHHQMADQPRKQSSALPPTKGRRRISPEEGGTCQPLLPGRSLDMYVHQQTNRQVVGTEKKDSDEPAGPIKSPTAAAVAGRSLDLLCARGQANIIVGMGEEHDEMVGRGMPSAVALEGSDRAKGPGWWRLEARQAACIGRVSRWFLHELGLEEPRREFEQKVGFLRKTEVDRKSVV